MPIKVEIIGDAPGQAGLKIVGLGGTVPGPGQMRLTRINSKTSLGVDLNWHADEQWLPLPELTGEGNALLGRVGPGLVDALALLGPSDIVGMAVRVDGRTEEGRVKTSTLCASHVHGSSAAPVVQAAPEPPAPTPPPESEPVAVTPEPQPEPQPMPVEPPPPPPAPTQAGPSRLPLIAAALAGLLVLGGAGAYFAGLFGHKETPAAEAKVEEAKKPVQPTAAAPSEINTREDLAKYIQATPEADRAYATARTLADKGKLDFAMLLFQHAARGGSNDASVAVARMYDPESWSQQTSPMPQADAETAAYWYEPPAQAGNVEAQRQLGKIMAELTPSGFQHDKGLEWLQKAAASGDDKAKSLLDKIK